MRLLGDDAAHVRNQPAVCFAPGDVWINESHHLPCLLIGCSLPPGCFPKLVAIIRRKWGRGKRPHSYRWQGALTTSRASSSASEAYNVASHQRAATRSGIGAAFERPQRTEGDQESRDQRSRKMGTRTPANRLARCREADSTSSGTRSACRICHLW